MPENTPNAGLPIPLGPGNNEPVQPDVDLRNFALALDAVVALLDDPRFPAGAHIVDADIALAAAIAESKLDLASDAAAGTPSRRTLGPGPLQAMKGNQLAQTDNRFGVGGLFHSFNVAFALFAANYDGATDRLIDATRPAWRIVLDARAGQDKMVFQRAAATAGVPTWVVQGVLDASGVLDVIGALRVNGVNMVATNDARVTADQAVGTASIRTLGTGAQQAARGDDPRFADAGLRALTITGAWTAGSPAPKIRRVGKVVHMMGGVVSDGATGNIGTIPSDCWPENGNVRALGVNSPSNLVVIQVSTAGVVSCPTSPGTAGSTYNLDLLTWTVA